MPSCFTQKGLQLKESDNRRRNVIQSDSLSMSFGFKLLCSVSYNRVAPASASSPFSVCSDRFKALGQSVVGALDPRTNEDVADMKQNSCSIQSTVFGSCLFVQILFMLCFDKASLSFIPRLHTYTPFPTAAYRECELCKR